MSPAGRCVLAVCHSHLNKCVLSAMQSDLGLSKLHDISQRNCAVNVVDYNAKTKTFRALAVDLPHDPPYMVSSL